MDEYLVPLDEKSLKVNSLQVELNTITSDLDGYIEKNSERSLEFMKFEAIERLATFISQYKDMIEAAKRLEEDFLSDPKINALQNEVRWFQERVQFFENIRKTDFEQLSRYQMQFKACQAGKKALEIELKAEKNEVYRLKKVLQSKKITSSPVLRPNLSNFPSDLSVPVAISEKEKVEYLKSTSEKLKNTLKAVKNDIHHYKTLQFQSRQEILPIEYFFKDCYKSVYQLIFQRQSQLADEQLSLAYKMFRENKMEYNEIKHKPLIATSRADSHVLREAISLQNQQRLVRTT